MDIDELLKAKREEILRNHDRLWERNAQDETGTAVWDNS